MLCGSKHYILSLRSEHVRSQGGYRACSILPLRRNPAWWNTTLNTGYVKLVLTRKISGNTLRIGINLLPLIGMFMHRAGSTSSSGLQIHRTCIYNECMSACWGDLYWKVHSKLRNLISCCKQVGDRHHVLCCCSGSAVLLCPPSTGMNIKQ